MKLEIIQKLKDYFADMPLSDFSALDEFYAENLQFQDPIHRLDGLAALKRYFTKLNRNVESAKFDFTDESITGNKVYLEWEMRVQLKMPKQAIRLEGVSVLTIEDKIVAHRDYFDTSEMFLEPFPLVGDVVRFLKSKIG